MAAPAPTDMAAPAPEAPASPVQESKDEDPPFDPDPTPAKKVTAGKHGQEYSQARHLARKGLSQAIAKAKDAGAKLDTKLDFGHKEMTLHDAMKECGMEPSEFGFETEPSGLDGMMRFISGFYNKDDGSFPLGGTRIKIKIKKAFEDGEFGEASPEDLMRVLKFIDMKDPSSDHHQQHDILRLAGVRHEQTVDEEPMDPRLGKLNDLLAKLQSAQGTNTSSSTSSNTSSGTINGQPANYDDVMGKFNDMTKNMKLKFGDEELDLNNPDQMGGQIQKMMGGMMKGVQGQVPNQNVQIPGGQMNPADMMKDIMSRINFGK